MAPVKPNIYDEYLPPFIRKVNPQTRLDKLKEALSGDTLVRFVDVRDALREGKQYHQVYYKTDNHWNDYGAYYAYRSLAKAIIRDFPGGKHISLDDLQLDTTKYMELGGGEAMMLQGGAEFREPFVRLRPRSPRAKPVKEKKYTPPAGFAYADSYEIAYENPHASLPSAVIIRDSFSDFMMQYFSEDFKRSVMIFDNWEYKANENIIENEKPQVVILELIETNLDKLLDSE